eukprot:g2399.t1
MTLAIGLAKRGYDVCLVERSRKALHFDATDWSKSYSYRIDIRGQTVLHEIGLLESMKSAAVSFPGMKMVTIDCSKVSRSSLERQAAAGAAKQVEIAPDEDPGGVGFRDAPILGDGMGYWITRPLLCKLLYEEGVQPLIDAGKIQVVVTHGEDWRKANAVREILNEHESGTYVLFGCDGVHSVVRDEVMRCSPLFDHCPSEAVEEEVDKNTGSDHVARKSSPPPATSSRPELRTIPCPSTGLRMKIVPIDCEKGLREYLQPGGAGVSTSSSTSDESSTTFPERYKPMWMFTGTNRRTLVALPSPSPSARPFVSNNDPVLNGAKTVDEFYAYLETNFPVCEKCLGGAPCCDQGRAQAAEADSTNNKEGRSSFWRACVAESAAKEFVESKGTVFPPVQYASVAAMTIPLLDDTTCFSACPADSSSTSGKGASSGHLPATTSALLGACLLGDSLHAFPPDLGQGVNCGLKDVGHLLDSLDEQVGTAHEHDIDSCTQVAQAALEKYNKVATKEARAMCELLAHYGVPYQYLQPMSFAQVSSWVAIGFRMLLWYVGLRRYPIGPFMLFSEIDQEFAEEQKGDASSKPVTSGGFLDAWPTIEMNEKPTAPSTSRPRSSSLPGYYSYAEIVEQQKWL